jgi:4-coumarate--CoA ligase (photoactive yellow protein activation family)
MNYIKNNQKVTPVWWHIDHLHPLLHDVINTVLPQIQPQAAEQWPVLYERFMTHHHDIDLQALELTSLAFLDLTTVVATYFDLYQSGLENCLLTQRSFQQWLDIIITSRQQYDEILCFQTSGSTGQPKLCPYSMRLLEQETAWLATQFADRQRIITSVSRYHIYGFLFAFMLPAQLAIPCENMQTRLPAHVFRQAQAGDLIIAHPAFLELASRNLVSLAPDVTVITSTAPCPTSLWQRLEMIGCRQLCDIYGSSETGGIGIRHAAEAPFQLFPYWSRDLNDPALLYRASLNTDQPTPIVLQDHLEWHDETTFSLQGRRDGAVQVAGQTVFPRRVEQILQQHPDVAAVTVQLVVSDTGHPVLKASVVPDAQCSDPNSLRTKLYTWGRNHHLNAAECPQIITIDNAVR